MVDSSATLATRTVKEIYAVSRLVREARGVLEGSFPLLWVEGEISNLAMPASGHIYFTLKDEAAQVRCAMFRNRNHHLRFTPENGMQMLLRVRVTLYEGRGEFQLIVEHMEEAGSGALQRAYEALKHRLGQEGLFDQAHKKPLPTLPKTIGIISSPDGAAVHDVLTVLKRRFPAVKVILYPVAVQGADSATQIAQAIIIADQRQECELLIMGRGGGSLEDLWSFNDEKLARIIYDCDIPIISAVGHEVDFTIADFVADVRAETPSAAAEIAVPDVEQLRTKVQNIWRSLTKIIGQKLQVEQRHLQHLQRRLPQPKMQLSQQMQRLDRLDQQLQRSWQQFVQQQRQKLDYWSVRLKHPLPIIKNQQINVKQWQKQLNTAMQQILQRYQANLTQQMRTLAAVSPLNTLERGYSITTLVQTGQVVCNANDVELGQQLSIRLQHGQLIGEITGKK